jgi:putative MFS transporter
MRCNALCVGIARISTIFTPFGIVKLFEYGGLTGVVTTIAGLFLVQAAVMAWIGAETSGRSIDDVESADSKDNALIQPDKFA